MIFGPFASVFYLGLMRDWGIKRRVNYSVKPRHRLKMDNTVLLSKEDGPYRSGNTLFWGIVTKLSLDGTKEIQNKDDPWPWVLYPCLAVHRS